MTLYLNKRIADLIQSQLPAFIREDYPTFVAFMEAYYEWMESNYGGEDQAEYGSKKLLEYADLDKTIEEFMVYFAKEFLVHIPYQVLCDRRKLLKNIKKFYLARGTEKSYNLLFRILFNDTPGFYYPTVDILRPDSGAWVQNKSFRCRFPLNVQPFDVIQEFLHKRVIGLGTNASAIVSNIIHYDNGGAYPVYELFFEKNSLYGNFVPFEKIALSASNDNQLEILPILIGATIINPGSDYVLSDSIIITNDYGVNMTASIQEVSVDGGVLSIQIINPSLGYPVYPADDSLLIQFSDKGANTATASPILGAVFEYEGYYADSNGFLDNIKKLRDDYFYQEFSYQVISHTNITAWLDIVGELVHPAGTLAFSKFLIEPDALALGFKRNQTIDITILTEAIAESPIEAPANGFVSTLTIEPLKNSRVRFGPTLHSLNRDAYRYLPSQWDSLQSSDDYWTNHARYSLADLANISLEDIIMNDYKDF